MSTERVRRLDIRSVSSGQRVGVANDGYWGIPVKSNTGSSASFYARASEGFNLPAHSVTVVRLKTR